MRRRFDKIRKHRLTPYVTVALVAFILGANIRNSIPVATVNGEPIDRKIFTNKLLRLAGNNVMNELITQKVIFQEARRRKLTVSKQEIKDKVAQLEKNLAKQGTNLNTYLLSQHETRGELELEIETQLLVEKMFKSRVKVTDADIDNYFRQNRVMRGTGAILESQLIAIRQQVYQEKLRKVFVSWLLIQARTTKVRILLRG